MKTLYFLFFFTSSLLLSLHLKSQILPALAPVFGENGNVQFLIDANAIDSHAKTHAIRPDGKIILAGHNFFEDNSYAVNMVQIDPVCGTLDSSFGTNGILLHRFEQRTICHDIALRDDGKIIGCGLIAVNNSSSLQRAGIFRFNSDGTVDSTFNGVGYRKELFGADRSGLYNKIMLASGNKIFAAGKVNNGLGPCFGVVKYKNNGELDSLYGDNGKATINFSYAPSNEHCAANMMSDSSIIAAGRIGTGPFNSFTLGIGKFTPQGSGDPTFGQIGFKAYPFIEVTTNSGRKQMDLGFLSDNRIIIAFGYQSGPDHFARLVSINQDGNVDSTFGENGIFSYQGNQAQGGGIFIDEQDNIFYFISNNWNSGPGTILKINSAGQLDATFGSNGVLTVPNGSQLGNRKFHDGFILSNGDILAYGSISPYFSACRITYNPEIDAIPQILQDGNLLSTTGLGAFQWYLNDQPIDGAINNSIIVSQNGLYTVKMGFENCQFSSEPFEINNIGVNIKNPIQSNITIRNNPSADYILVDNISGLTLFEIYNVDGKLIQSAKSMSDNQINVKHLSPGMYFIHLLNDKNSQTFKVIRSHN